MSNLSNEWQMQEAKNKLSQVVKEAADGIPQFITVHGRPTAVVLSAADYQKMTQPNSPLSEVLSMPILEEEDVDYLFERSKDVGRGVEF